VNNQKYTIKPTTRFKKDLKRAKRQGLRIDELEQVIQTLAEGRQLDKKYRDHSLTGDLAHCRECHIRPDWLLIYEIDDDVLYLYLTRTGTHAELFGK